MILFIIPFLLLLIRGTTASSFSITVLNQTGTHCSTSGSDIVTSTNGKDNIVHSMPEFLPINKPGTTQRSIRSQCTQFLRIQTARENRIVVNRNGTNVSGWAKITAKEFLDIGTRYQWVEDTGFDSIGGGVFIGQGPIEGRINKQFGSAEATSYCGGGLLKVTWDSRVTTSENVPAGPPGDSVDQSWKFTHSVGYAVCNE